MKKYLIFASAALLAFAACNKENDFVTPDENNKEVVLTFTSARPQLDNETKTAWDAVNSKVIWSSTDKIRVGFKKDGAWWSQSAAADATAEPATHPKFYASSEVTIDGTDSSVGTFNVPISDQSFSDPAVSGKYQFFAVYPQTLLDATVNNPTAKNITIKETQSPSNNTFDAAADVLLGKSEEMSISKLPTDPIELTWTRVVAHAVLTFSNMAFVGTENVSKVTLTFNEEAKVTGTVSANIEAGTVGTGSSNVLTLDSGFTVSGNSISVWACVLPVAFTSLDVEIKTDKATYTRSITGISGKAFKKNAKNTLTINMLTAGRVAAPVYDWVVTNLASITSSDVFVIVGNNGNDYAMNHTSLNSNGAPNATAVTVTGTGSDRKLSTSPIDGIQWNLTSDSNGYMFYPNGDDSKWLNLTAANNGLRVNNTADNAKYWTLDATTGYLKATDSANDERYVGIYSSTDWRSYKLNSGNIANNIANQTFAFYVKTTATPRIAVESPVNVPTAEGIHTISIDRINFTGTVNVSVPGACKWLTADDSFDDDDFDIMVGENTGAERSVTLTLSGTGISDVEVEIVQAGITPGTESNPYSASDAYTAASALSDSESVDNVYVQGYISEITYAYSSTNNNISFNISDDGLTSGNQLNIFKMLATDASDFMVGDFVKIKGTLLNYNGTKPEIDADATLISQVKAPRFSVAAGTYTSAQTVSLTSTDGATIYYTLNGSEPTTSSSTYSSALNIAETTTVKAFAVKGGVSSKVVSVAYTINANANDGSQAHPFTVAEVRAYMDASSSNRGPVYISGIVSSIVNEYDQAHGTGVFYISDDGLTTSAQFEAYSVKFLGNNAWVNGNTQIAVGNEVVIYGGELTIYSSSVYETKSNSGSYLYSLNGSTAAETVPTITKTDITGVSSDGISGATTTVSFSNNAGWTASAAGDGTIVTSASLSGTTVTYSVAANTGGSRTGTITITLSKSGRTNVTAEISVGQEAKPGITSKTYTIVFTPNTTFSTFTNSYTKSFVNTCDGLALTLANVNNGASPNGWSVMRAGRNNNNASVATITTNAAISEAIKTVTLHVTQVDTSLLTYAKLIVSSSSNFSSASEYSFSITGTGNYSATVESPATNQYYKIEISLAAGSSNGHFRFDQIVYTTD